MNKRVGQGNEAAHAAAAADVHSRGIILICVFCVALHLHSMGRLAAEAAGKDKRNPNLCT